MIWRQNTKVNKYPALFVSFAYMEVDDMSSS